MFRIATIIILLLTSFTARAQEPSSSPLFATLQACDSLLFNVGYNTCDVAQVEKLVSDHFEFYHDEAGITSSKAAFITGIRDGLCKLPYKPRRELVPGSLQVYPMYKSNTLYGAVQTGEHIFYAIEKDGREYETSRAKFASLWLLEDGQWRMSRVISYDHVKPAAKK